MRADIAPAGIFPDYELTDHTKTRRKLSELQGIEPMILVLSRGQFCQKDHLCCRRAALRARATLSKHASRDRDNRAAQDADDVVGGSAGSAHHGRVVRAEVCAV